MTFERFADYTKTIAGSVVLVHLFITRLVIASIFGSPLVDNFFPVAGPIGILAALGGWWIIYRAPAPVVTRCPACHQRVVDRT